MGVFLNRVLCYGSYPGRIFTLKDAGLTDLKPLKTNPFQFTKKEKKRCDKCIEEK